MHICVKMHGCSIELDHHDQAYDEKDVAKIIKKVKADVEDLHQKAMKAQHKLNPT